MKKILLTCLFGLLVGLVTVRAEDAKKEDAKASAKEVAIFKTSAGEMVIELWPDVAPKTVENFIKLAKKGYYDGTAFHRIIKDFMIQGGDPNTKNLDAPESYGQGGPGYTIPDEFNDRSHTRGVISMANTGRPNSAGSQFFICTGDASQLNHHYTAFGKLIKGDDVLTKLANSPVTGPNSMGEMSIPKPRVVLESVKIVPADSIK
ncbi:MAG TPA: peptidylprolyl isomerase [Verrucomicrobiae bacterium]|jgi:peptidyl-prolyl cis-trans isomerase B (cyclophilin B)|nr:peptidylprolyl isomerase [Verrucomicrobiae bacterium]